MMTVFEVEPLLEEVSPENPCGDDLEYEPAFLELERKSLGVPEQVFGDYLVAAETVDWRELRADTIGLFSRSKDLRLAVHLTRSLINTDGLDGLRDGLGLIVQLIQQYWHCLHPQLDLEDDNDPTIRMNTLAALCDQETMLRELRRSTIVDSRAFGRFSLRDVDIALGKYAAATDDAAPQVQKDDIDAAFLDCDLVQLESTAAAATASLEHILVIEQFVAEQVGPANAVDLYPLRSVLLGVQEIISGQLADRGAVDIKTSDDDGTQKPTPGPASFNVGEINSREDVLRALAGARDYLARNEPSSPVPPLLNRAMRLLSTDFISVIQDIAPDAISQVETIRGLDSKD
jgi:type VI secretion system protein ImpA